ncbi:GM20130 [Drosophila sechellia]|uniref:GM20130 n=1 Tax=Drosophila sechellia TaxID=7238 RepID=B4HS64_DROSE|nr:GM20130 [Drosophila sechellia]
MSNSYGETEDRGTGSEEVEGIAAERAIQRAINLDCSAIPIPLLLLHNHGQKLNLLPLLAPLSLHQFGSHEDSRGSAEQQSGGQYGHYGHTDGKPTDMTRFMWLLGIEESEQRENRVVVRVGKALPRTKSGHSSSSGSSIDDGKP